MGQQRMRSTRCFANHLAASLGLILVLAGCATNTPTDSAEVSGSAPEQERIAGYQSVGRIKWKVPENAGFYFAVPHFTAGPRLKCEFSGGGQCEIRVHARVLTMDSAQRQKDYFTEMELLLPDAVEKSVQVRSYGPGTPVLYATLTDKQPGKGWRYLTQGLYVKGTFVIQFEHLTNDATGDELKRVLRVVHSAEPLDALAFLTWKLSDYKAVCEDEFPALKQKNDAAFAASKFANVDWIGLLQAASPDVPRAEIEAHFENAQQDLLAEFVRGSLEEWRNFCEAYPKQVAEAQRGM